MTYTYVFSEKGVWSALDHRTPLWRHHLLSVQGFLQVVRFVTVTDIVVVGSGVGGGGGGGLVYIFLLRICLVVLKDITQEIKRVINHLSSMTTTL